MGSTVLAVTLGRHSAREDHSSYRDTLLTAGPPMVLLLLVLMLGLYLPDPIKKIFVDAAAIVEVKP
jgi:hydrogenase-4 component F